MLWKQILKIGVRFIIEVRLISETWQYTVLSTSEKNIKYILSAAVGIIMER